MMQVTDFGNRDDRTERWLVDQPSVGCILVEREMSAGPVIVREVRGEDASQVPLAENDDMVQALAPHRTDEALRKGIRPRATRGGEEFLDPHTLYALPKRVPVDAVTIVQQIGGCGVVREGVHDLLGGPVGGGVL